MVTWDEIELGMELEDSWWPLTVRGTVTKKLKSKLTLSTPGGPMDYDRPHAKLFLRPITK